MTSLKDLSVALGLLTSDHVPLADADGWKNYVWRVPQAHLCLSQEDGFCRILQSQWDWKRPQRYSFAVKADLQSNTVTARITLDNQDPNDTDQVCIVASFLDKDGNEIGLLYVNWRAIAGRRYSRDVPIRPQSPVDQIETIVVGSKQCDLHAAADAANFIRLRTLLRQR